tara:strand:- start:2007 stop:2216 length:210 start_codon:yes stop_codon:yes gene_type:complete
MQTCLDNRGFGFKTTGNKKIGILRIDYDYPSIPGDVDSANSFNFDIEYEIIKGLTFELAQTGYIDNKIK